MRLEQEFRWVTEADEKQPLEIVGLTISAKDKILLLRNGLDMCQMSVYGKNFNFLYNVLGNESEAWNGKHITFKQEVINGKNVRTITSAK